MDSEAIRQRNYRMVETLRHQNRREQMRLDHVLYSRQGMLASHHYKLEEVSRIKRQLQEDLVKIRQTGSTTFGVLPPREDENQKENGLGHHGHSFTFRHYHSIDRPQSKKSRKLKKVKEKTLAEQKATEEKLKMFNQAFPIDTSSEQTREDRRRYSLKLCHIVAEEWMKENPQNKAQDPDNISFVTVKRDTESSSETGKAVVQEEKSSKSTDSPRTTSLETKQMSQLKSPSIGEINVEAAKENVVKRLLQKLPENILKKPLRSTRRQSVLMTKSLDSINEQVEAEESSASVHPRSSPPKREGKRRKKNKEKDPEEAEEDAEQITVFDSMKYNPDGTLRTVHSMPDFHTCFREAKKARYIRHREKQWFEKELSIKDIFDVKTKEKNLAVYS